MYSRKYAEGVSIPENYGGIAFEASAGDCAEVTDAEDVCIDKDCPPTCNTIQKENLCEASDNNRAECEEPCCSAPDRQNSCSEGLSSLAENLLGGSLFENSDWLLLLLAFVLYNEGHGRNNEICLIILFLFAMK